MPWWCCMGGIMCGFTASLCASCATTRRRRTSISEVFLDVWRQAGGSKELQVSTWLLAIARNKACQSSAPLRQTSWTATRSRNRGCCRRSGNLGCRKRIAASSSEGACRSFRRFSEKSSISSTTTRNRSADVARIVGATGGHVKTRMFHARRQIGAFLKAAGHLTSDSEVLPNGSRA